MSTMANGAAKDEVLSISDTATDDQVDEMFLDLDPAQFNHFSDDDEEQGGNCGSANSADSQIDALDQRNGSPFDSQSPPEPCSSRSLSTDARDPAADTFGFDEGPIVLDSDEEDETSYTMDFEPMDSDSPNEATSPAAVDPFPGEEIEDCGAYVRKVSKNFCLYCGQYINDKAKWLVHSTCYFIRRQVEAINRGEQLNTDGPWVFQCEIENCTTVCSSLVNLRTHMTFHFEKALGCKACGHTSYNAEGMTIHLRTHNKNKPYKCSECPKSYTQKLSFDLHYENHHARNKTVRCRDKGCRKMFSSTRMMLEHLKKKYRWQGKPKDLFCSVRNCAATFKTPQEKSKHYFKKHPGVPVDLPDDKLSKISKPRNKIDAKADVVNGKLVNLS